VHHGSASGRADKRERSLPSHLPPKPDFQTLDASASLSADRRTLILANIGSLVFNWSNNESMLIYLIMLLMNTDEASAAIVFSTLNTTRARLDLIQRLAKVKVTDESIAKQLTGLVDEFNRCTKVRNEFNHSMYAVNAHGEVTHTHSMRIRESRGRLMFGETRDMDDARLDEMADAIRDLTALNRELWEFLPVLQESLAAPGRTARPATGAD
jgi:hypothetical protein